MRHVLAAACLILLLVGSTFGADLQIDTLENGLKVMILENHQVPQVNVSTTIKVGLTVLHICWST